MKISDFEFNDGFVNNGHDVIMLSNTLQKRMAITLKEEETETIDIIKQLEESFPDKNSFEKAPFVLSTLRQKIDDQEKQLRSIIFRKSLEQNNPESIQKIKDELTKLGEKAVSIRNTAGVCQETIYKLTSGIKKLDRTKKNLDQCILLLERIRWSVLLLQHLMTLEREKNYRAMTSFIQNLEDISKPLKYYDKIQQIMTLCSQIDAFKERVGNEVALEFERAMRADLVQENANSLKAGFIVLSMIDTQQKPNVYRIYIDQILLPNRELFAKLDGSPISEKLKNRFRFLAQALIQYQDIYQPIFPPDWSVDEKLVTQYCLETKITLGELLRAAERESRFSTEDMIKSLVETKRFELDKLNYRFKGVKTFNGSISEAFDQFMWHFVHEASERIGKLFENYKKSLGQIEEGVFSTCIELVLTFQGMIKDCEVISNGQILFDLGKTMQKWFGSYNLLLGEGNQGLKKSQQQITLVEKEFNWEVNIMMACAILNTCDYCKHVTEQFEEHISKIIVGHCIDFKTEGELFLGTASETFSTIVEMLLIGVNLDAISAVKWASLTAAGDQSPYISNAGQILQSQIPKIRNAIKSNSHFKMICDKFAESILREFYNVIIEKVKYINEIGAEQLLVDTYSLKSILMTIPSLGVKEKVPPTNTYLKILDRGVIRIERPLKVVASTYDSHKELLKIFSGIYLEDHNESELTSILGLKGVDFNERNLITKTYRKTFAKPTDKPKKWF